MSQFKHECDEENARKFWDWLQTRGGIAVWKSVNLGNAGASWSTPATIAIKDLEDSARKAELLRELGDENAVVGYPKTNWQMANEPTVYTDPADVGVFTCALYKAFPVGLKRGDGFSLRLSDAGQAKLDKHMDACREKHGDAFYRRGVLDIEGASMGVYYTTGIIPISEWIAKNAPQQPDSGAVQTQ